MDEGKRKTGGKGKVFVWGDTERKERKREGKRNNGRLMDLCLKLMYEDKIKAGNLSHIDSS